ncbi:hypothetical protein THAR02_11247, partial [Trichoderma harzianum]
MEAIKINTSLLTMDSNSTVASTDLHSTTNNIKNKKRRLPMALFHSSCKSWKRLAARSC